MRFVVDGEQWMVDDNIKVELDTVFRRIQEDGRHVRTIRCNGEDVRSEDLFQMELGNDAEIVIQSGTLDELVEDTMKSVQEYTPKLLSSLSDCVHEFRQGHTAEGATQFSNAVPGLNWTYSVLVDLCNLHSGPSLIHDLLDKMKQVLPALLESWENADNVLVADLMEFELLPTLLQWSQLADMFVSEMQAELLKQGVFETE